MARNWTRAQQRRYREQRREQAARVAARLIGKKKNDFYMDHDDWIDSMKYQLYCNMHVPSPRMNSVIYGINGV